MGCCVSSSTTPAMKTKLILPDGGLREFDRPVKVSHVLQQEPGCFVCDADDMDFDGFVRALRSDEELRQGQLYFVLPKSALERPLHADDLAALAVKTSRALMMAAPRKRRRWRRVVAPLLFASDPLRVQLCDPAADPEMKKRWSDTVFKKVEKDFAPFVPAFCLGVRPSAAKETAAGTNSNGRCSTDSIEDLEMIGERKLCAFVFP